TDPDVKNRLRRSQEDFDDLFSAISDFQGDYGAIKKVIKDRVRFSEIHIGGDSATISYKIATGQGKGERILGYLLIDANLEENYAQVEYWEEEPKVPAIQARRSKEAEAI